MEQKEERPSEGGTAASPSPGSPATPPGGEACAEREARGAEETVVAQGPADAAGKRGRAPGGDGVSAESQGAACGLDEVEVEPGVEAEAPQGAGGKEDSKGAPQEATDADGKEETKPEPKEPEGKEREASASENEAEEKEATLASEEKGDADGEARAGLKQAAGGQGVPGASQGDSGKTETPEAGARGTAGAPEAEAGAEEQAALEDEAEAEAEAQESDVREEAEPGGPNEERGRGAGREPEDGAAVTPSSPEEWPESPTDEGQGLGPDGLCPDTAASGESGHSASEPSPSEVPQSPTEPPPSQENKKEKAPERRVPAPVRPRGARAQNRKAIVDKFGGAASGPTALFRNTKAAGAAIGGVKNMLLEWCRAMTRNYEHVDVQNFSSSWSSGMAFCALIHKFFPEAFDYAALDPTQRRHNFTLAFSTAEKLADCAQLLEVEDMVRLAVPDSKCVYTYIQELYRSLVQKGLVKTKKK